MTHRFAWLLAVSSALLLAVGCIDHRAANARAPTNELPDVTSDCPAAPHGGYFRKGELIIASGETPDPEFQLTDMMVVVNGQPRVLANQTQLLPSVFFREVVPAGQYPIQVIARWKGLGKLKAYRFQAPFSHSVRTDGVRAVCVDIHLSFKAGAASEHRPQLRAADANLPTEPPPSSVAPTPSSTVTPAPAVKAGTPFDRAYGSSSRDVGR